MLFLFFLVLRKLVLLPPASKYVSEGQRPDNKKNNYCLYDSEHGVYRIIQKTMVCLVFLVATFQKPYKNIGFSMFSGF